jgi:tRNA A-37 threonylcarbamoyl transferase component Bud32
MATTATCGRCGAEIAADAAFCPNCGEATARGRAGGPVLVGFTLLRVLGRGGAAVVYLARQEALDRMVAVKVLRRDVHDPKAWRRFRREARTIARLSAHPNVVTVYTAGRSEAGEPFIVTEYLDRGSLADVIAAEGPLQPQLVARMGASIADALSAAHEIGILHRDVKPANVFLDRNGRVKLGDFGIARLLGGQPITITDSVAFTPEHVAPEILRGEPDGTWTDVYGLASTLAAAMLGEPLFAGAPDERVEALLSRKLTAPAPILPAWLPSSLTEPIARALDPDPMRRPPLGPLRRQLASAAAELGSPVPLAPPTPGAARPAPTAATTSPVPAVPIAAGVPRRRGRRRRRLRAVAAALVALTAFATAIGLLAGALGGSGSETLDSLGTPTTRVAPPASAQATTSTPRTSTASTVPATSTQTTAVPATAASVAAPPTGAEPTTRPTPPSITTAPNPTSSVIAVPPPSISKPPGSTARSAIVTADQADLFVRSYYDLVRAHDYERSWTMLAPEFQRGRARSYEYYSDFWNRNDVDVAGVTLVDATTDRALVIVEQRWNGASTVIRDQLILRLGPDGQLLIARETILDS